MKKLIVILFSVLFLSSCAFMKQQEVRTIKIADKTYIASYPAELRGAYFYKNLYCAEPSPDVGVSTKNELTITNTSSGKLEGTIVELDGRDPTVLLAREMLYRICEMGINYPDDDGARTLELYRQVLTTIVALAEAKKAEKTGELEKAKGELEKAKTEQMQKQLNFLRIIRQDPELKQILQDPELGGKLNSIEELNKILKGS